MQHVYNAGAYQEMTWRLTHSSYKAIVTEPMHTYVCS